MIPTVSQLAALALGSLNMKCQTDEQAIGRRKEIQIEEFFCR